MVCFGWLVFGKQNIYIENGDCSPEWGGGVG